MVRLIGQLVWKGAGKHFLARDFCRITGHFSDGQSPCDWWMRPSCLNSRWAPDTEGLGYRIAAWSRLTFVPLASPKGQMVLSTNRGTSQGLTFINTWPYNYYLTCMYQLIRGNALIVTSLPKASVHLDILSGGNGIGLARHSRKPSQYCWWSQSIKSKSDEALSLPLWCDKTIRALRSSIQCLD